jgi:RHS repeat-associated protein
VARQLYDAWGNIRASASSGTMPTDIGYTGQRLDNSTGLMYYRARYYASYLNRWLSPDTIVPDPKNPQSLNRYAYTLNNPVKYIDPTGHFSRDEQKNLLGFKDFAEWQKWYDSLSEWWQDTIDNATVWDEIIISDGSRTAHWSFVIGNQSIWENGKKVGEGLRLRLWHIEQSHSENLRAWIDGSDRYNLDFVTPYNDRWIDPSISYTKGQFEYVTLDKFNQRQRAEIQWVGAEVVMSLLPIPIFDKIFGALSVMKDGGAATSGIDFDREIPYVHRGRYEDYLLEIGLQYTHMRMKSP